MDIKSLIVSKASRAALIFQKHAPAIMTGTAIVSGLAATGFAVYSTLKIDDKITEYNIRVQLTEKNYRMAQDPDVDFVMTDEQEKRELTQHKVWFGLSLAELYLPTLAFTTVAIACTLGAHNILSKRNAALASTVSLLANKFADYRSRVIEEYGIEADRKFYNGYETVEIKKDDGTVEKQIECSDNVPGYDRYFDEFSIYWDKTNPEMNVAQIRSTLMNLNTQLINYGHVFLNDAYRALGMEDTPAGSVMGWIYDKDHPDTVIDFGVNIGSPSDDPWDFINDCPWDGRMGILLNFNVDPEPIYNRI